MATLRGEKQAAVSAEKYGFDDNLKRANKRHHVRKPAKAKAGNRRCCSLGSTLVSSFILICGVSFSIFNSRQGQKPVLPPVMEMMDPDKGPMYALTSQDEWCASIVNHFEPPEEFKLWPLMANLSLMSRAGTYNHKHFIMHPELIVRDMNSTKRAVFIICVTEPTLLLIVDFNRSFVLLTKTDAPCELT